MQAATLTGTQLRQLPNPPVDANRDMFLLAGPGDDDALIAEHEQLRLVDGMSFITVPKTILAGDSR